MFAEKYTDKIYKIGIGTNGSIPLPLWFNDVGIRTHIFLSRHQIGNKLPGPKHLGNKVHNPLIDFRVNCNLIRGGVDSVIAIKAYIDWMYNKHSITHFCFRELNNISLDDCSMYPQQVYQYAEYYKRHLVHIADIEEQLVQEASFIKSRHTGNQYDKNNWYWYTQYGHEKLSIKFRTIDETKLIAFNQQTTEVDEYVIHPDGTLTGCWDKDMKIIKKGGEF